ncbi:MAG TPA: serine hydrolase domain-containing protein [Vicinamibacteria bacterium]|nr:serine hydrolase domain-containing protein [Vicinamibacteria bacterium]
MSKVSLLALTLSLAATAATAASRDVGVDALFRQWDRKDTPGCALGVIQNGELLYSRAYGMANLEHDVPLSTRSVFRTGSLGKQFTAFAILLAEQQGKLSVDDDVRLYLPELPETERPITIRHLIHHTSGLRDYLTLMELAGFRDEDFYTEQDILDRLSRQENLNFEPGSEYLYSNTGYFLLSQILLRATGSTLAQFAARYLFEPLGMRDTHFHDDFRKIVPGRATGYRPRESEDGFEIDMTTLNMVGDGGVFTTVEDLVHWDRNFYSGEVGGAELARKRLETGRLDDGRVQTYAYGLTIGSHRGHRTVSHGGAFVGFRSAMIQFPDDRFSVYVLCNLATAQPTTLAEQVADIFLELEPEPEPAEVAVEAARFEPWTGVYFDESTGDLAEIVLKDGALYWQEAERKLSAVAPPRFRVASTELTFDPPQMRVERAGQRPFAYRRVETVTPDVAALARYVGLYHCRELDLVYRIELDDSNQLVLDGRSFRSPMTPVFHDGFRWEQGTLVFSRGVENKLRSFELSAGRARNFVFVRQ